MKLLPTSQSNVSPYTRYLAGLGIWVLGWLAMLLLDGTLDLSGLGMLLVLTAALASVWLPMLTTLLLGLLAVAGFNWMFVPPRGTLAIDLHQHAALLLVMFALNAIVAGLMSALRGQVLHAQQQAQAANTLRAWGDKLRDAEKVHSRLPDLKQLLETLTRSPVTLLVLHAEMPGTNNPDCANLLGAADPEQTEGLWYCLRNGYALGANSEHYQELSATYLPLRGRVMTYGAALLHADLITTPDLAAQAQDLCDQTGTALERHHLQMQKLLIQQTGQAQELRAMLLTAIAHEYRTPLATIMSAASSLAQQDDKFGAEQRRILSRRIVDEAARLRQMTGNILHLARLDAPGVQLSRDWETAEELVGSLMQRWHPNGQYQRLLVNLEAGLPLLWCDSLLISQLLDNLVDNALKYSVPATPITIGAHLEEDCVILSVRDQGPGIEEAEQESIFQVFRQGQILPAMAAASGAGGVGIGLALCRVIAQAHGGKLRLESSVDGSCFQCLLPLQSQPVQPEEDNEQEPGA